MTQGADAMVGRLVCGPVDRRRLLVSVLLVVAQAGARFVGNVVLQKQRQEEVEDFVVGLFVVFARQRRRVGAGAEARVFGGRQRQSQVLAEQQRLAVEPGRAAVPALDRRRVEDVLPSCSSTGTRAMVPIWPSRPRTMPSAKSTGDLIRLRYACSEKNRFDDSIVFTRAPKS